MKKRDTLAWLRKHAPRQELRGRTIHVEPIYEKLGKLLCEIRERRELTQAQVAASCKWGRASIANIEHGKQRILLHNLPALAAVLGVSLHDILDEIFPVKDN